MNADRYLSIITCSAVSTYSMNVIKSVWAVGPLVNRNLGQLNELSRKRQVQWSGASEGEAWRESGKISESRGITCQISQRLRCATASQLVNGKLRQIMSMNQPKGFQSMLRVPSKCWCRCTGSHRKCTGIDWECLRVYLSISTPHG